MSNLIGINYDVRNYLLKYSKSIKKISWEVFMWNECIDTIGEVLFRWPLSNLQQFTNEYFRAILCFGTLKNNGLFVSGKNQIFHLPGLDPFYQTARSEVPLYKVRYFDPH